MTGWAILGLEAAGRSPFAVRNGGATPIDYLRREAGGLSAAGDLERTILALDGAGVELAAFRRPKPASGASPPHLQQRFGRRDRSTSPRSGSLRCAPRGPSSPRSGSPLSGCTARRTGTEAGAFSRAPPATRTARARRSRAWPPPARAADTMHRGVALLRRAQDRDGGFPLARHHRLQLPVDGVGDPGAGRGGREPVRGAGARPLSVRLPRQAPARRRPLPLLGLERPDSGLGHRPGARGRQARGLPRAPGGPAGAPQAVVGARGRRIQRVRCFLRRSHDQPDSPPPRQPRAAAPLGRPGRSTRRNGAGGGRRLEALRDRSGRGRAAHRPAPWSRVRMDSRSAPRWTPRRRHRLPTATPTRPPTSRVGSRSWRLPWRRGFLWYRRRLP